MNRSNIEMRRMVWRLALCVAVHGAAASTHAAEVEAYAGEPFGVGRITFGVNADGPVSPLEDERFNVASADGRVLYPVLMEQPVRRLLRRLLEIESPRTATMFFLFRGAEPFEMQAFTPAMQTVRVTPQPIPQAHQALMERWWAEYAKRWRSLLDDPKFPPVVENFLAANLSRRLGLPLPPEERRLLDAFTPKKTAMSELLVTESHRMTLDQSLLRVNDPAPGGAQPLPPPMPWYDLPPDETLVDVAVEPIAAHVPAEAFYLRFGSFQNYFWFRSLSKKWEGELANMVSRRGIERAGTKRIEQQLSLSESVLAQFLGPQVIQDVAIIGLDPYMNDGAAIGILFHAKNNVLLAQDLNRQRRAALAQFPDAAEETVRIADRDVSLIATPNGQVRSYYYADGDFHLTTTSRRLMQRFILAGQGERALAASTGFRKARQRLSIERADTAFVYVSPEFFRELTSPHIWIESQRRARSAREMKLLQLARLQANAEAVAATTPEELVAAGLLPQGFGHRADGSELEQTDLGPVDSVRGMPGTFIPVADMETTSVTPIEADAYRAFAQRFRQEIGQTPPVAIAMHRVPLEGGGESMSIDVLAGPLDDVKLGRLPDALGEPSAQRLAPVEGDLIRGEFVLDSPLPLGAAAEPHHLFFGVRDFRSPLVVEQGRLEPGAPPAELVRMYVGAWPKPGGLIKLFLGDQLAVGPEPVPGRQETWQARRDDFLLISFKPDVVEQVLPQLQMVPAAAPAQAWLEVANLEGTDFSRTVNAFGYSRGREASLAAARLMNTLANQLHVPRELALKEAESLMDGTFVCPLGGEYELADVENGVPMWTSTAVAPQNRFMLTAPPEDYMLPLLTWFRGLRAEARLGENEITAHIEVDMSESAVP
jgi:hypothetical protein